MGFSEQEQNIVDLGYYLYLLIADDGYFEEYDANKYSYMSEEELLVVLHEKLDELNQEERYME